jgi:hypothetical protein
MGPLPVVQQAHDFGLRQAPGRRVANRSLKGSDRLQRAEACRSVQWPAVESTQRERSLQPPDAGIRDRFR